jgi:hypothetical protein
LIGPSLRKKTRIYGSFPKTKDNILKCKDNILPFGPSIWVKGGQHLPKHIWDKIEVLWRTCWGTYWELEGNIV